MEYEISVETPRNSLAKMPETKNEMIVTLEVPKSEYKNDINIQTILQWAEMSVNDQDYFRDLAVHFENDKGLNERSIVFTHAKITLEEYGNVKEDFVTIKMTVNQRRDKFTGVMFGINLDDTYKRAWERANNPPTVNIVIPPAIENDGIEYAQEITNSQSIIKETLSKDKYLLKNIENDIYSDLTHSAIINLGIAKYKDSYDNNYFLLEKIIYGTPDYSIKKSKDKITIKGKQSFYIPYNISVIVDINGIKEGNIIPKNKISIIKSDTNQSLSISLTILFKDKQLYTSVQEFFKLVSLNKVYKRVNTKINDFYKATMYFYDARTQEHIDLIDESQTVEANGNVKWSLEKTINWKSKSIPGGKTQDEYIHEFKIEWLSSYRDIIKKAAQNYNLPELVLAGVLYIEAGGQPPIFDDVVFGIRYYLGDNATEFIADKLNQPRLKGTPDKTSFGDVSMQVRVAAEILNYDYQNLSIAEILIIIESLKDINFGIFICAKHLEQLKNIDYSNLSKAQLTDEHIKIITTRYNRGPSKTLEQIIQNTAYGERILSNKEAILKALQ